MSGFLLSASHASWWRREWACCGGWSSSSSVSSLAREQFNWVTGPGAANLTFDRNKEWFKYLTWFNKFEPPFKKIIPMPITFYSDEYWASFMNFPKMQYCTMQVIMYIYRVFAGNLQKQNWKIDTSMGLKTFFPHSTNWAKISCG